MWLGNLCVHVHHVKANLTDFMDLFKLLDMISLPLPGNCVERELRFSKRVYFEITRILIFDFYLSISIYFYLSLLSFYPSILLFLFLTVWSLSNLACEDPLPDTDGLTIR